mmetsp:Transcript_12247/g.35539  ORF Transcript_12247/g.35539 Transcript_12247/m.35539 type:complete len:98 (+) Transcript_12247:1055-1348(+)
MVTNIDAEMARLTKLKGAATSALAERERAEEESEAACMACLSEPRAIILPCGCKCYCAACHSRILAGPPQRNPDDMIDEEEEKPEPTPKCPLCRKPF